jgi:hypothetical protein
MGDELLKDKGLGLVRRAGVREILADMDADGSPAASAAIYRSLAMEAAEEDRRRTLEVKGHVAAELPGLTDSLLRVLSRRPGPEPIPEPLAMLLIADAARDYPNDPILAYLLARQHFRYRDDERAIELLDEAERLGLKDTTPSIWLEARLMRARALFQLDRHEESRRLFQQLANDESLRDGVRGRASDWADRCDFSERRQAR